MAYKILIMGLSGAGKTTLANQLNNELLKRNKSILRLNADEIRKTYDDWDFSYDGRIRQSKRMTNLANTTDYEYVICDFIAPLRESRINYTADYTIWIDTIASSKYADTDSLFVPPNTYNYRIKQHNDDLHLDNIICSILGKRKKFDILPNIQIPEHTYLNTLYSGIDSLDECKNKPHFVNYTKPITYQYNSRGFRDNEWPNNLQDSIWCFGDSFTVGLGQPFNEIWTQLLSDNTKLRTINVSLDGGSVNWITRQVIYVLQEIQPKNIIIQWTYLFRREHNDISLSDKQRRLHYTENKEDFTNFIKSIKMIDNYNVKTNIIHSFIPNILDNEGYLIFLKLIKQYNLLLVDDNKLLDYARDYHHYDINTSTKYVNNYIKLLV